MAKTILNGLTIIHEVQSLESDGTLFAIGQTNDGEIVAVESYDNGAIWQESPVRIWAGATMENKEKAPFRVHQNGGLYATNAYIEGTIMATSGIFAGYLQTPFVDIQNSDATLLQNSVWRLNGNLNIKSHAAGGGHTIELPGNLSYVGRRVIIYNSVFIYTRSGDWTTTVRAQSGYILGTLTADEMRSMSVSNPTKIQYASYAFEFIGVESDLSPGVCSWMCLNYNRNVIY